MNPAALLLVCDLLTPYTRLHAEAVRQAPPPQAAKLRAIQPTTARLPGRVVGRAWLWTYKIELDPELCTGSMHPLLRDSHIAHELGHLMAEAMGGQGHLEEMADYYGAKLFTPAQNRELLEVLEGECQKGKGWYCDKLRTWRHGVTN